MLFRSAYLGVRLGKHDAAIQSFCLWFERAFSWEALGAAIELLTTLRGADLLRVKGLVNVAGESGPVVVQGAQHVFHPPVTLAAWPDEDHRSRLVFIGRHLERDAVRSLLESVAALKPPA